MDKNELSQMLGVKPNTPQQTKSVLPQTPTKKYIPSASDTALELDSWDISRGGTCYENSDILKEAFKHSELNIDEKERMVADFHGTAFLGDPELVENCTDETRHSYVKQLLETPDCKVLRQSTILNTLASELAATQFGVSYGEYLTKEKERKPHKDPGKEALKKEMALIRATSSAIRKAQEDVSDLNDLTSSMGLGGDGGNPTTIDVSSLKELFAKIKDNPMLHEIINRAGRFRRFAQAQQRQKTLHGYDDMVGITVDDDVSKILSTELARLFDEDLELDVLLRITSKQAMARQYQGVEKIGKGPIICCVDESGSMSGDKIQDAKAFALALYWIATYQKRWLALIGFAGGTEGTLLVIPPGKPDPEGLLKWLVHFFSGGTCCDVPLVELPNKFWPELLKMGLPQGKTDLIVITDGIINCPKKVEEDFNNWKREVTCKAIGLMVRCGDGGGLAKVLDEVYPVSEISIKEDGVKSAFSI